MNVLLKPALTVHLFGGLDVCWLALILLAAAVAGVVVWRRMGAKKGVSRRILLGVSAAIGLVGLAASCTVSVLTDATPAETTSAYLTLFGITVPAPRVAFTLAIGDGYDVYWYGILIALGFLLALGYGFRRADEFGIDKDRMMDVVLVGMIGAIVCARAYYLMFDGEPITSVAQIFAIHDGGIAIYGGVIGALLFGGLTCRLRKIKLLDMYDLAALGFPIGQAIGRWGNFINQEVYGKETGSAWFGMTGSSIALKYGNALVHPLFLYESVLCLAIFLILRRLSKNRRFSGQLFCLYLMLYAVGRFFLEGQRDTEYILRIGIGISVSQLVSVAALLIGLALYLTLRRKALAAGEGGYEAQFGEAAPDPERVAVAYQLLGCEWDADDGELAAAYAAARAPFENMAAETEEQKQNVADKLEELAAAYAFLQEARAAEDGEPDNTAENEETEEAEKIEITEEAEETLDNGEEPE